MYTYINHAYGFVDRCQFSTDTYTQHTPINIRAAASLKNMQNEGGVTEADHPIIRFRGTILWRLPVRISREL